MDDPAPVFVHQDFFTDATYRHRCALDAGEHPESFDARALAGRVAALERSRAFAEEVLILPSGACLIAYRGAATHEPGSGFDIVELTTSELLRGEECVVEVVRHRLGRGHWYRGGITYRHAQFLSGVQMDSPVHETVVSNPYNIDEKVLVSLLAHL
jgi:hypothetical protein